MNRFEQAVSDRVTWGANPAVIEGRRACSPSLEVEEVDPAEAITPAPVREIHGEQLAKLEA